MSTQQSTEQQLIDQTRSQIRGLVSEISQLAKSDVTPLEFYTEFLTKVVSALAAAGGAVYVTGADGNLEMQYQINMVETNLVNSQENQARHSRLLYKVMKSGEGTLVPPQSGAADDDEAGNPTDFLLVLGPLKTDQLTAGVLEVFQRPNAAPTAQRGYLRFVLQMCDLASDFLKTRRLREITDRQVVWLQLENFTRAVHASLDPIETAFTIANEGRRLIDCDRVSVAIKRGNKAVIQAISGQDLFDKRSNTVSLLNRLASTVVMAGEPVWYTGDTSDMPPQVEEAIQAYVDDSHSKTVAVLPLKKPKLISDSENDKQPAEIIGALIVEQIENARLGEGMLHRVDVVSDHSSSALTNAIEHQSLFLMPLWRTIGKSTWVVKGRTLPKTVSIGAAVVAALVALTVIPADFDLKGEGTLKPEVRHEVYAALDGRVEDVAVKTDQMVRKDQLLLTLRSTELEQEAIDLLGKREAAASNLYAIRDARAKLQDGAEKIKLVGQEQVQLAEVASLDRQIEVNREKQKHLKLLSPIEGQVMTWDIVNLLINRTVQRGQLLVSVADPSAPWELEVLMPEDRMGHVIRAQLDIKKELPVRYVLATRPGTEYEGVVKSVHSSAEVRGDEGNTVIVQVSLDERQLIPLREQMTARFGLPADASPKDFRELVGQKLASGELTSEQFFELSGLRLGATVTAKVHCGRAAIGYVWFHDLVAFVQRTWFTIW